MTFGRKLRVLKRALERAALRLKIKYLNWIISRRTTHALTMIATGEAVRDAGERIHDSSMIADGYALIDRGAQELNEIETGHPAEPRPASWWQHRI